jgi:hypothetical protein
MPSETALQHCQGAETAMIQPLKRAAKPTIVLLLMHSGITLALLLAAICID